MSVRAALSMRPGSRLALAALACLFALVAPELRANGERSTPANYPLAEKYSPVALTKFVYSTSVVPNWIGKTDTFWYEYRTSAGRQFYRVDPRQGTRVPLFDRGKLATFLSEATRKPIEPILIPLSRVSVSEDGNKMKFVTEDHQYEYDLLAEKLVKLGKAPPAGGFGGSPEQLQRLKEQLGEERFREFMERQREFQKKDDKEEKKDGADYSITFDLSGITFDLDDEPLQLQPPGGKGKLDYRSFSPDKKLYVFVKDHNLYLAETGKSDSEVQLSKDGEEEYTFSGGPGFGGGGKGAKGGAKSRPSVTWAKDSKAFYVSRTDTRGVKELFLVNSVAQPRPTLMKYKYAMPGEEKVRRTELHVWHKASGKLTRVEPKWKDEWYTDIHWGKNPDELRFTRRDRLHRNAEVCSLNLTTNECRCLISDGFENANIVTAPVRYLDDSDEMIWWSERSGWGHFYLYERGGKLKNAITSGPFRASSIVSVDTKNRLLYFRGNHREEGENAYYEHLYCVRLDGTGLTLLDPGNAHHVSYLSPSRQFVVDNCSRVDQAPLAVLRDHGGKQIMELERADLSKLYEYGWKMPETFTVKAADGTTDLYGNLWKPFDFDARKKYPIIAHVYPGPQTESISHGFSASNPQQQLAQLGFIVVQVGNRGGSPLRSKLYGSYGYWNMRDYALPDKKAALEQLAARHPWIDLDRVGIYGHSGGGFLTAAALLQKPYNEFFKVGVSSAGNHDNNIYNNSWAERYHGLKEVPATADGKKDDGSATTGKGFKGKGKRPPDEDEDEGEEGEKKDDRKVEGKKDDKKDDKKVEGKKDDKKVEGKKDDKKDEKKIGEKDDKSKPATRFEIKVPTNAELAGNLKGKLLLVHGDMDNNVHPAGTIRLVEALIKANKRFDMLILPGKAHGFADFNPYFTQRMWEYFAEHLLGDRPRGADLYDRRPRDQ